MTARIHTRVRWLPVGRIVILTVLIAALFLSGKFAGLMNLYGLAFVVFGGAALLLMSYDLGDIGDAFRGRAEDRKRLAFWESASRSFWLMGVLATLVSFVIALTRSGGGIAGIATLMASSLIATVYGLVLAVICLIPWLKIKEAGPDHPEKRTGSGKGAATGAGPAPFRLENFIGYGLFAAILLWTLISAGLTSHETPFPAWKWVVHGPSLLVVFGGTVALVLFVGDWAKGKTWTLGFALTGIIGSLLGLIQVLLGIAVRDIHEVALALTFILSSCFFALLGMMLVGAPLEDRSIKRWEGAPHSSLSRAAWYIFPLVTMILLVITLIFVITPIKQQ